MSSRPATLGVETSKKMGQRRGAFKVVASYVFDWVVIMAAAGIAGVLGQVEPNKRPFSLTDPDISFPFTEKETVTSKTLVLMNACIPIILIAIISLLFVPGTTVPPGTPRALIWRRKLWELHAGWQGLALALATAWFVTSGMKNMFGRPRPDLLARCQPNLDRMGDFVVGGLSNLTSNGAGLLVSAAICTNPDDSRLDDGFRSFPSGHSSSAAAGLIYLSLFIASKFAIAFPFLAPTGYADDVAGESAAQAACAFPSRVVAAEAWSDMRERKRQSSPASPSRPLPSSPDGRVASHARNVLAARRQAAAPPVYLLCVALAPTFAAVFVAASRFFDFRHHAFDILFGFGIGILSALLAFRWYHLPLARGAGWAWGPRSHDKAFWAGVGSYSYATDRFPGTLTAHDDAAMDEEKAFSPTSVVYTSSPYKPGSGDTQAANGPHPGNRINSTDWSGGRAV